MPWAAVGSICSSGLAGVGSSFTLTSASGTSQQIQESSLGFYLALAHLQCLLFLLPVWRESMTLSRVKRAAAPRLCCCSQAVLLLHPRVWEPIWRARSSSRLAVPTAADSSRDSSAPNPTQTHGSEPCVGSGPAQLSRVA